MEGEALDTKSTHNSNAQLSEKYSPLWKCSKPFIPPRTDGIIRSSFNIGCSESKVIFKWRKNSKNKQQKTNKKALQTFTRRKGSHLVHFTNKHSRHGQSTHRKARREPAIRDSQKLAQNVFPPWNLDPPYWSSSKAWWSTLSVLVLVLVF